MPGFDGTGPRGDGPMTGGGRGRCATGAAPNGYYGVGRGGMPRGGGRGRSFGGGRGEWGAAHRDTVQAPAQSDLEERLARMEGEMQAIKEALDELKRG